MMQPFQLAEQAIEAGEPEPPRQGVLGAVWRAERAINGAITILGGLAFVAASLVLSYSVVVRYWLKLPTDWQDETATFLLLGAIFLSAAGVQARRGHIGIEAIVGLLPDGANRVRVFLCDVLSFLFCAFFAWKSWTLFHEAWSEGMTSTSTWGPPMWIPYVLMAAGMSLLAIQIALQIAGGQRRP